MAVSNVELLAYSPGETITYHGHSTTSGPVYLELTSTTSADVVNDGYARTFNDIHVPTADNEFSVTASPVSSLSLSGKPVELPWSLAVTCAGSVSGTTGSYSASDLPVHAYDVQVFGDAAGSPTVDITVTVSTTVTADSHGDYTMTIDTAGLPEGVYYLRQNGASVAEMYLGLPLPPEPPEFSKTVTVDLNQGWNLISLPVQPSSTEISSIFTPEQQANINVIWDYNGGDWKYWTTEPGYTNQFSSLDPQKGYYIYCFAPMSITLTGCEVTPVSMGQLQSGWNLVGYPKACSTWIPDIYGSADLIWKYDDGNWYYWTTLDGYTDQFDVLYPGLGYWVLN